MDKKRAVTNITVGIVFKIIVLALAVVTKSFVVKYVGDEANGLYSLYVSIIGFLTIANLGVGSAITYSLYKPIVENDKDAISALYNLYKKFYLIVMFIILGIGLLLTPFVPMLAKGTIETSLVINNKTIYITYITFLISIAITYLFGHKITLINAYKDNYVTTFTASIALIIEGIIQIVVLILTKNFFYFLLIRIFAYVLEGILIEVIFRRKYKERLNDNKSLEEGLKKEVIKNSGAKMYAEVGSRLISSFDGIIISFFAGGVVVLGNYSNYLIIITGMYSLLNLIFTEITSIVGQLYVSQSKETYLKYFGKSFVINFVVGLIFFLGYIAISHNLIEIIFTKNHIETNFIMLVITFDYFINFLRRGTFLFKNSSGLFYDDRHRPLVEGIVNIILSIILVQFLGVGGVLLGTIITRLAISYTWEPYVLFKNGFERSPKDFYKVYYSSVIIFMITALLFLQIPFRDFNNVYLNLLVRGTTSVIVSSFVIAMVYLIYKPFRNILKELIIEGSNIIKTFKKNKKQ